MNFLYVLVKQKSDIDNAKCGDQIGVIYRSHNQQWKYFHWMKTAINFTDGNRQCKTAMDQCKLRVGVVFVIYMENKLWFHAYMENRLWIHLGKK